MTTVFDSQDWSVAEIVCTAEPSERPFQERREHFAIAAVVEGHFSYLCAAGRALLHPGALLLGNAETCFECGHDHGHGDRCLALQISPEYFSEVAASAAGSGKYVFSSAMLPAIPELLPWLARLEARLSSAPSLETESSVPRFIEVVLAAASGRAPVPARYSARDECRVAESLRYIELHADEPLDLATLAGVACMSKYHFLRTFGRIVGLTPHQFLLGVRMRRAAVRLARTRDPIATVAYEAGFADLSTFNGRFRDVFGVAPGIYRSHERRGEVE